MSRHAPDIRIAEEVAAALAAERPVVALESTVIAHGLPFPDNLETARACEQAIRAAGAVPATVGIVNGAPIIGLNREQLEAFARGESRGGERLKIDKVGLNNLAAARLRGAWGATTVAGTLRLARLAGLRVFATGGIGGAHRGAAETFDISADLTALATTPLVCVAAGAKAILDLPKTLEYLETLGVPVVGYGTDEFPAFYSRQSGLPVDARVETPDEAARLAALHWQTGGTSAVLVCAPVPEEFDTPFEQVERAAAGATAEAARAGVRGKAITPFLLARLRDLTGGRTLAANRALLVNNAAIAARIAVALTRRLSLTTNDTNGYELDFIQ